MGELSGKVAFVTGAARGQGRSHASALAEAGADVAVCDISEDVATVKYPMGTTEQLAETVALVEKHGRKAISFDVDVRDAAGMRRAVHSTIDQLGAIDIAVANHGIFSRGRVDELSDDAWRDMIDINLTGVFNLIRAVIPSMTARGSGRIVATSSAAGKMGAPNMSHYAASKWGVIGLVKSAAYELAQSGVTVNAICPTNVNTDMLLNEDMYKLFMPATEHPTLEEVVPAFRSTTPMGIPWVEPEDITNALLFLVSDGARYITGETVSVMGGQSAANVG